MSLQSDLKRFEGLRLEPYRCTAGKLSIGYGRNLDDKGITKAEAEYLFSGDIDEAILYAEEILGIWPKPPTSPQAFEVLVHLVFWIGAGKVQRKFPRFVAALREARYADAALELRYRNPSEQTDSALYEQVPARVNHRTAILQAEQTRKDESCD